MPRKYQYRRENNPTKHEKDRLSRERFERDFEIAITQYLKSIGFHEHAAPRANTVSLGDGCYRRLMARH